MTASSCFKNPVQATLEIDNFKEFKTSFKHVDLSLNENIIFRFGCYGEYKSPIVGYQQTWFYLQLTKSDKIPVSIRCRISIVNANGDNCETRGMRFNIS